MERFTYKGRTYGYTSRKTFKDVCARLAAYEDTGLEPGQVVELQEENVKLITPDTIHLQKLERTAEKAEAHGGIDHLVALDEAAMQGRMVILPCNINTPIYLIRPEEGQKRKQRTCRVDEYHIDHFTIGGAMIPMITACSEDNEWEALIDGSQQGQEYFLSYEEAQAAIAKEEVQGDG